MTISYGGPLGASLRRTRSFLLSPFDLVQWLAVAFTAWLASLADGNWWGSGVNYSDNRDFEDMGSGTVDFFENTYEAVVASVVLTVVALGVILILIAIAVLLLWISSRARFMFLDNVVRRTGEVKEPWARFREAGHSLFLWRLGFGVVATVIMGTVVVVTLFLVVPLAHRGAPDSRLWATVAFGAGLIVVLALLAKFVDLLLNGFVVPIMYKTGLPVTDAWRRFLPLFRDRLLEFILFALLTLAIHLGVFLAVVVLGLLTCCVGFILIALPYVNAVVLLPVLVFFRYLPVEFLNQFGEEFRIDLGPETGSSAGPPPPAA